MRYLGLDLGTKTLGIAISDKEGMISRALQVIRHNEEYDKLVLEVVKLVSEEKIDAIVLGFPKNMNNTVGPRGEVSILFKSKLEEKLNIPIYLQDERLSTKEAEDILIKNNTRRKNRRKVIDKLAATIILQTYLDKEKNNEEK